MHQSPHSSRFLRIQASTLIVIGILSQLGGANGADSPRRAPAISVLEDDSKLQQKVAVAARHIYLGELIQRLARDLRVDLRIDDSKGPVSGIGLSVFVRDVSGAELLGCLPRLLSHRHDSWEWQAAGKTEKRYVLRHQRAPGDSAAFARNELMQHWMGDLRQFHQLTQLPPEKWTQAAQTRPDLFALGSRVERASLFGTLQPTEMEALIRGVEVPVDRSRLSGALQQVFDSAVARAPMLEAENQQAPVAFKVAWEQGFTGPVLWARVGREAKNLVGGRAWDIQWRKKTRDGWNDGSQEGMQTLRQQWSAGDPAAGTALSGGTLPEMIANAVRKQPLNIVFDPVVAEESTSYQNGWLGRTPEQTVRVLAMFGENVWRQFGTIALMRPANAAVQARPHLVAWPWIQKLRSEANRDKGYLSYANLQALAQLTTPQLTSLAHEFPDAHPSRMEFWRPIFVLYGDLDAVGQRELRSPNGLRYGEIGVVAQGAMEQIKPRVPANRVQPDTRLRLRWETATVEVPGSKVASRRQLVWELLSPGEKTYRAVFAQLPRRRAEDAHDGEQDHDK